MTHVSSRLHQQRANTRVRPYNFGLLKGRFIMRYRVPILCMLILLIAACSPAASPTTTPASEAATPAPTFTPMPVEDLPGLELLSGAEDTCTNAEGYTNVLGFDALYYETTTANRIAYRFFSGEGRIIVEDDSEGENKNGEEGWGFYPPAYAVPAETQLTIEVTVYATTATNAPATSRSILTYNCTTGTTIDAAFTRNP
jgi:hypothetical protein